MLVLWAGVLKVGLFFVLTLVILWTTSLIFFACPVLEFSTDFVPRTVIPERSKSAVFYGSLAKISS